MCLWGRQSLFIASVAASLGLSGTYVSADSPSGSAGGGGVLTWADCMATAIEHNPDIRAAQFNLDKACSSLRATKGARFPSVSLESSSSQSDTGVTQGGAAGATSTSQQMLEDETSVSLITSYQLYSGGRVSAEIRSASAARRHAGASLDATRHTILCDLRRAFTRLLYAQELSLLSESIARQRKDNLDLVQLRFEGGIEHKGSYMLSSALNEEALMDIRKAGRTRRVAQLELARLMGTREPDGLCVTGTLQTAWDIASTNWDERVSAHPLWRAQDALCDVAKESVEKSKSKMRPTLALVGSSSVYSEEMDLDQHRWKLALVLSLPVFTGGQNINELAASEAGARMAGEELLSTQTKLRTQMESALLLLIDARERVEVQRTLLKAVTVRSEIARQQFNSGLLRFENWDLIENDGIAKQKQMLDVLRDAMLADTDLRQALGSGDLP